MAKRIVLYGKSVFIAGLAEILSRMPEFTVSHCTAENLPHSNENGETILLIDLCDPTITTPRLSAFLQAGNIVLGINPADSTIFLISGSLHSVPSLYELVLFIKTKGDNYEHPIPSKTHQSQ